MDAKRGFIQFIPMLVLGVVAISTFVLVGMIGKNQDNRGRAATPTVKYTCEVAGEGLCSGNVVSNIYCGSSCKSGTQECCITTIPTLVPATSAPVIPSPTPVPTIAGECCIKTGLAANLLASATTTCSKASYGGCANNTSLCEWKNPSCVSVTPIPTTIFPTVTLTLTPKPTKVSTPTVEPTKIPTVTPVPIVCSYTCLSSTTACKDAGGTASTATCSKTTTPICCYIPPKATLTPVTSLPKEGDRCSVTNDQCGPTLRCMATPYGYFCGNSTQTAKLASGMNCDTAYNCLNVCLNGAYYRDITSNVLKCGTATPTLTPRPTSTPTPTPVLSSTPVSAQFCTGPNDIKMSDSYGCVLTYKGTFNQGCCTLGTAPNGAVTCTLATKPTCTNSGVPTCSGTAWVCPTVAPVCTSGKKQCSGMDLQTCTNGIWISQVCPGGCTNDACTLPGSCSANMMASCKTWGADSCIVPTGGIETCTLNGHYYFSQRDPRWSTITLTCANGKTGTFDLHGCGETSLAMLLSQYVDASYTPDKVTQTYFQNIDTCGGSNYEHDTGILRQNGFTVDQVAVSMYTLKNYVKNGWQVWAYVEYGLSSAHYVVIIGVDGSGNFIVNDPYYGAGILSETKNSNYPYGTDDIVGFNIIKPPSI